mgnify:FL=1
MKPPLYVLDGYSLVFRSYFAFIRNPLRNPRGENSSALFGFVRTLATMFDSRDIQRFLVALDSKEPTFRHKEYPEYKATREATPAELKAQIPKILAFLEKAKIPQFAASGFEADDIIATLARRCVDEGRKCYIISGDKDLMQLVDDYVHVLRPDGSGSFTEMDAAAVKEKYGVPPKQIRDMLSLLGDTSDNVPGVKGIGEKTASKLLGEYGDLDGIYEALESISSKSWRTKLEEGRESAMLSRRLVTLRFDVDTPQVIDDYDLSALDYEGAAPLLIEEGMNRLVEELIGKSGADEVRESHTEETVHGAGDVEVFRGKGTYTAVTTKKDLDEWIATVKKAGTFAFDCETDSLDSVGAHPVGVSIATEEGAACYIPIKLEEGEILSEEEIKHALREILEDTSLRLVAQNGKYDIKVMAQWGIEVKNFAFDTMIAAWLLDTTANSFGMDALAERRFGYRTIHYDEVVPKGKTFDAVPLDKATEYAAEDADITLRLAHLLEPELEERGLTELFNKLEMPLIPVLARMELEGIGLDTTILSDYSRELEEELGHIQEKTFAEVGHEFNMGSTKQLQQVLFEERKLTPIKKTKTGYSTDTSVLHELAREDTVPALVLRHRLLAKLKSTYVDALPKLVNEKSGRLHTNFQQTGTATGRLSSVDPNLQNIPIRDEEGRRIRTAFVPRKGYRFVSADYSQIELVILAHLSGDEALSEAFRTGEDVHRATAVKLFGMDADDVTPEQRRIAKTINFGVMYGMSAFRLSNELGIPRSDADAFIKSYFALYSGIRGFIDKTVADAEKSGYVRTILGRERPVPTITSKNKTEKAGAERIAVNTPIQGSAADIVKRAMLRLDRRLRDEGSEAKLLLQVHDELILECPAGEVEAVRRMMEEEMTAAVELDVPLRVSVEDGKSWGELH